MIVRDASGNYLGIACDTCAAPAPSAAEIAKAHGLIRMGWYCSGGAHRCPEHHPEQEKDAA